MKAIYFLLPALVLSISACKKKESSTLEPAPVQPVETSCECSKDVIGVTMPNNKPCYGFLSITSYTVFFGNQPYSAVSTNASFGVAPKIETNAYDTLTVDSLFLADKVLYSFKTNFGKNMYYFRDLNTMPEKQNWRVFGANGIPSFDYSPVIKLPTADLSHLPTVISKALVTSFPINDAANFTRGWVFLANSLQSGPNISLILKPGNNNVCFPSDLLQKIDTGKVTLTVTLENIETKAFDNKEYAFLKRIQLTKTIELKN